MRGALKQPPAEQSISDGMRYVGRLVLKGHRFECFGDDGRHLGSAATVKEARSTILDADRRAA